MFADHPQWWTVVRSRVSNHSLRARRRRFRGSADRAQISHVGFTHATGASTPPTTGRSGGAIARSADVIASAMTLRRPHARHHRAHCCSDRLHARAEGVKSLSHRFVRAPDECAAGAGACTNSPIARTSPAITFAPPHAAFSLPIDTRSAPRAACTSSCEDARGCDDQPHNLSHPALGKIELVKSSRKAVRTLAHPMLSPSPSGRRSGDALELPCHCRRAAPDHRPAEGGRSVV